VADSLSAQDVVARIREGLGVPWQDSPIDAFSAGRPQTRVTGIATSFSPSLKVLRQAAAANRNMIIAREHVFYSHGRAPAQLPERLKQDPVCAAKQDLIERHNLVIWRFSENWDRREENPQLSALARTLGWSGRRIRGEYFTVPSDSLGGLAAAVAHRLRANGVRVIGSPQTRISKVALAPGMMLVPQLQKLLQEHGVDAVITGEPVEWEASPYFQDVIASGQKKGMIILGHAVSQEPGCGEMASWLKKILPGVPVDWMPSGEPFRATGGRA
jgi:putative NIF3 family GTP cyclohydrolase 1 type 2